jgi:hypothetical protein
MGWTHVAHMGEMRNPNRILVGKPEGKRLFRRLRHRYEDNMRKDLKDIGWEGVDWMHLAQDRDLWWALVKMVTNLCITYKNISACGKGKRHLFPKRFITSKSSENRR